MVDPIAMPCRSNRKAPQVEWIGIEVCPTAITGMGGISNTELITASADRAELDGDVPAGVNWISTEGYASRTIESLATFTKRIQNLGYPKKNGSTREKS